MNKKLDELVEALQDVLQEAEQIAAKIEAELRPGAVDYILGGLEQARESIDYINDYL